MLLRYFVVPTVEIFVPWRSESRAPFEAGTVCGRGANWERSVKSTFPEGFSRWHDLSGHASWVSREPMPGVVREMWSGRCSLREGKPHTKEEGATAR